MGGWCCYYYVGRDKGPGVADGGQRSAVVDGGCGRWLWTEVVDGGCGRRLWTGGGGLWTSDCCAFPHACTWRRTGPGVSMSSIRFCNCILCSAAGVVVAALHLYL